MATKIEKEDKKILKAKNNEVFQALYKSFDNFKKDSKDIDPYFRSNYSKIKA